MQRWRTVLGGLGLGLVVAWIPQLGAPDDAGAQSSVRRSAGSMSRSLGSRRSGSLDAAARGREAGMSGSRESSEPVFRKPDDDPEPSSEESERSSSEGASVEAGDPEVDADQAREEGERTLGRACIYGVRGEVIYRPRGGRCRGDAPAARDAAAGRARSRRPDPRASRRPSAVSPGARATSPSSSAAPAAGLPRPTETASDPDRPRGACIYGPRDRVIYAPPGVQCGR